MIRTSAIKASGCCALWLAGALGCVASPPVAAPVAQALVADPGPTPHEGDRIHTLWLRPAGAADWRAGERVLDARLGGRIVVDRRHDLRVDGVVVDQQVAPGLAVAPDGALAYTRVRRPLSDIWHLSAGGARTQITRDGQSDRPFFLPDGTLLWISSAGTGWVGWRREGRPFAPGVPVPAQPLRTRWEAGRVVFDAGEGEWWWLDPDTGDAGRQP